MSKASYIRQRHFEQFATLLPEEQIKWSLTTGYALRALMSKDARRWAERLRNGGKKILSRARISINRS